MLFKPSPADFHVEEIVRLPTSPDGAYTVYRLEKQGITTLRAQERLAAALGVPRSAVAFPALKDKEARSVQYGTLHGVGPARVSGAGFFAERVGRSDRPLSTQDLLGNRFTAVVRQLLMQEGKVIHQRLADLEQFGFPNYFDQQRFGSYASGQDLPGKLILLRDAEGALRAHLAQPFAGDPSHVKAFKKEAQLHWGEWQYLLGVAPKPSNFRSVLTFLADHPQDYRQALNLVTPRVLSLYLAAYQSLLWNRLAGRYLSRMLEGTKAGLIGRVKVAGEALPYYAVLTPELLHRLRAVHVPLFQQRMTIADSTLGALSEEVLTGEGLRKENLKARLLERAYLARGTRRLLAFPTEASAGRAITDDSKPGTFQVAVSFVLPPGSYATLMLKILMQTIE